MSTEPSDAEKERMIDEQAADYLERRDHDFAQLLSENEKLRSDLAAAREEIERQKEITRTFEKMGKLVVEQAEERERNRLYAAVAPFVELVRSTSGRIPVERLSFANWHSLCKAFPPPAKEEEK